MYRDDLARIHHEGFGDLAREAASALLAWLRRAGWRRGRVVDLGCGGGTWLRALGAAGFTVRTTRRYGHHPFAHRRLAFLAKKR